MEIESRTAGSQKISGKCRSDSAALLSGFYSKTNSQWASKRGLDWSGYMYNAQWLLDQLVSQW